MNPFPSRVLLQRPLHCHYKILDRFPLRPQRHLWTTPKRNVNIDLSIKVTSLFFCNILFILSSNFYFETCCVKYFAVFFSREKILLVFEHCTNEICLSDKLITKGCQMSKVPLVLQPRSVEHFPL